MRITSIAAFCLALLLTAPAHSAPPEYTDSLVSVKDAKAARGLNKRGLAAHKRGQYAKAVTRFTQALKRNPRHVLARYNLACALARDGKTTEALTQLEQLAGATKCRWCGFKIQGAAKDPDLHALLNEPRFKALDPHASSSYVWENCAEDTGEDDVPTRMPRGVLEVHTRVVSPDGRWVALVARRQGDYSKVPIRLYDKTDIWLMSWDGADLRRLTRSGRARSPGFHPDSSRLVYVDDDSIWTMDLKGRARRRLVQEVVPAQPKGEYDYTAWEGPMFGPQGRWVALLSANGATSSVYVVRSDGSGLKRISEQEVYCFAWDGTDLRYKGAEGEYEHTWPSE